MSLPRPFLTATPLLTSRGSSSSHCSVFAAKNCALIATERDGDIKSNVTSHFIKNIHFPCDFFVRGTTQLPHYEF
uniref:Putative secreted protein n=1 Tax=Lutzomyia longipalpis TaxID=7200 RepID=A0A7G3AN22_LUTLO